MWKFIWFCLASVYQTTDVEGKKQFRKNRKSRKSRKTRIHRKGVNNKKHYNNIIFKYYL